MTAPLTHLRLVAMNTHAFCGVKVDRYTRCKIATATSVTCLACLAKGLEFHAKAMRDIERAQKALQDAKDRTP